MLETPGHSAKLSVMPGCEARKYGVVLFQDGVGKTALGSTQEKKKFACPQKNVEKAAALQVVDIFAVQSDFQRAARAFLDKGAQ